MTDTVVNEAVSILRMGPSDSTGRPKRVKESLKRLDGVYEVEFDYLHDHVLVKYDPAKLSIASLKKAILEEGSD